MKIGFKLLFLITDADRAEKALEVFHALGLPFQLVTHGHGSASSETLELLGLQETRKKLLICLLPEESLQNAILALDEALSFKSHGAGIAFSLMLSGASRSLSQMVRNELPSERMENDMTPEHTHELILAIVERGTFHEAMEAARGAGASGGTLLHALGLGSEEASRFLGITVQPEKDLLMTLVKREQKAAVMQAIVEASGIDTKAHGLCMSLPVDTAIGLREMQEDRNLFQ